MTIDRTGDGTPAPLPNQLHKQIGQVSNTLRNNIEVLLQRRDNLENLASKTTGLNTQSSNFASKAEQTKRSLLTTALVVGLIGVVLLAAVAVVAGVLVIPPAFALYHLISFSAGLVGTLLLVGAVGLALVIGVAIAAVVVMKLL